MIRLDDSIKVPIYEQLYKEIKRNILSGAYGPDYRLPAIRTLAQSLNISHNTVNRAYQLLLSEGYIRSTQGSGFYVEELQVLKGSKEKILENTNEFLQKALEPKYDIKFDFSRTGYANEGFSWGKWSGYVQNAIIDFAYKDIIEESPNMGSLGLRREVCKYMEKTRGVSCTEEQIIICPNSEQGMEIIVNILPEKKYKVGIEEPSSEKMRRIMMTKGFIMNPIPVTPQGLDVNLLEKSDCNLLYITPSFQFPTGVTLPLAKRIQLLEWCRRNDVYCIENDYESEYLFGSQPIMSMQALDTSHRVIYIGTFSNIMTHEIKVSFIVLPNSLLPRYEEKYKYYRCLIPEYEQSALTNFIMDGSLDRQSRRMAILNQKKKKVFFDYVCENMSDIMRCSTESPGTHCLIEIYGCKDSEGLIHRLKEHGIQIYSTREYWYHMEEAPENVFMISFSSIYEKNIIKACAYFEKELRGILKAESPENCTREKREN
ncbi:MAG: PLP-dependent aminotransferase family protein [Lachnospiraceae bacterium]|nr:PLP-dependent aminotransferase family protein [Lachnospiraceae bacterium]